MNYEYNNSKQQLTIIGKTNWRNSNQPFGIKDNDRLFHIYSIGKTGTGKSTLINNMVISDIQNGKGLAYIDPHGDSANTILDYIPHERIKDVIYFNPSDTEYPIAFNPIFHIHPKHHQIITSNLISVFNKIWDESWGPRMEHILRYSIITLLEYGRGSILDIQRLLTDGFFRKQVLVRVTSPEVLSFWQNEFEKMPPTLRAESISPILNKMGYFNANPMLRNILGQKKRGLKFTQILDESKLLICNLSKGSIGEDSCKIIGSLLVTHIQLASLYRVSIPEQERIPFYLFVDEVQNFIGTSFVEMLSECRKFGLGVFLTNQFLNQLPIPLQESILSNVGTIITFRVGTNDAFVLSKDLYPYFNQEDLINLPRYSIYIKLCIDGQTSKPFSADTFPLLQTKYNNSELVINTSRNVYAKQKKEVEEEINQRYVNDLHEVKQVKLFE